MQSSVDAAVELLAVPCEHVSFAIEECGDMLQLALNEGGCRYSLDNIREACEQRDMQMFLARGESDLRGVLVTQIVQYPTKRILEMAFMAGIGISDMLLFEHDIEKFARECGVDDIEIVGRIGWSKVLGKDWRQRAVVLVKRVH